MREQEDRMMQENNKQDEKIHMLNGIIEKMSETITAYESVLHEQNKKIDEQFTTILHLDQQIRELEKEREYNRLGKL